MKSKKTFNINNIIENINIQAQNTQQTNYLLNNKSDNEKKLSITKKQIEPETDSHLDDDKP